jgi:hypothetical protein
LPAKQGPASRRKPFETRYNPSVARQLGWTALVVAAASLAACAGVDDTVTSSERHDAAVAPADGSVGPTRPPCVAKKVAFAYPQQADVLILLDRSGSMDTVFGTGTRYEAVASVLSGLVATYADHVRFGYQEMPGKSGCSGQGVAGCCASPPAVGIGWNHEQAIASALAAAAPMEGETPTAAALAAAADYFATLDDGVPNRYVLLATDGVPNCSLAGTLSNGAANNASDSACADALAEVAALAGVGIRTIVLGVGADVAADASGNSACLDAIAHAGGAAASPGSPGYYTASDPDALALAVEQIFGGVTRPSCSLTFDKAIDSQLLSTLAVYFDGQEIPLMTSMSGNGWYPNPPAGVSGIHIIGSYCDLVQHFQVNLIEALSGCPPCVDVQGCK